ncbi:MAG: hotdog family protein, partial [Planctomycetota bacterium]
TRFRDLVRPGDTLTYYSELVSVNESGGKVRVRADRDGRTVAESGMVFAFKYVDDPKLDARRRELMAVWLRTANGG